MFLNIKTEYNFSNSLNKIDGIFDYLAKNNVKQQYLGMVNDNSIINSIEFIEKCKKNDIQAILGVRVSIKNIKFLSDVILYAMNLEGLEQINEILSTYAEHNKNIDVFQINFDNILLVFETAHISYQMFNEIIQIFQEKDFQNYYIGYSEQLILQLEEKNISKRILDRIVFVNETRFIYKDDFEAFSLLNAMNKKKKFIEEKRNAGKYKNLSFEYILNKYKNMDDKYKTGTINFLKRFSFYEIKSENNLNFESYNKIDFKKYLNDKLNIFLIEKSLEKKEVYYERLNHELKVITKLKFINYFLIMEDIVNYCINNEIIYGYGRGSAAGSLVAFLLKITKIDPIEYNLYFERFLNSKRATLPDIDLDIQDIKRAEVIEFLINKYGNRHVAKIFTTNKYLTKSSFSEIAKAIDFPVQTVKKISSKLKSNSNFEDTIQENYKFFSKYFSDAKFNFLRNNINKIENLPKNTSVHAAGVIISSETLYKYSMVQKNIIFNEAKYLENVGYIKFDLLSLSTLNFIGMLDKEVCKIDDRFMLDKILLNDSQTFENLGNGNTLGVFQMEAPTMKDLLKKYKPQNILDIAILIALHRPGPMDNINVYLQNKNNPTSIKYDHPLLIPILKDTFGILIFQEQIMEVVKVIARFDDESADIFRVAISKKQKNIMDVQKNKFLKQGQENNISLKTLIKIYNDIEKFAGYGFNKAHSVSYARLIYDIMYIKSNYKEIFYSKLFKGSINSKNKSNYISEIKNVGLQLLVPDILKSKNENIIKNNFILLGFENIRSIDNKLIEKLIKYRNKFLEKYRNKKIKLIDFLEEVIIPLNLSEKEIDGLVFSGSFNIFKVSNIIIEKTLKNCSSMELFILRSNNEHIEIKHYEEYSLDILEQKENEGLGINILYSSENNLKNRFFQKYAYNELSNNFPSKKKFQIYEDIGLLLLLKKSKEITTKDNKLMAFLLAEDENGIQEELICFPKEYEQFQKRIKIDIKHIFVLFKNKQEKYVIRDII